MEVVTRVVHAMKKSMKHDTCLLDAHQLALVAIYMLGAEHATLAQRLRAFPPRERAAEGAARLQRHSWARNSAPHGRVGLLYSCALWSDLK